MHKILQAEQQGIYVLKFVGEIRLNLCSTLDQLIESITNNPLFKTVVIDLTETTVIDSTTLGLLAKIAVIAKKKNHFLPTIISTNPDITRIIIAMGFDQIFLILKEPATSIEELQELPIMRCTEEDTRLKVLDAHKVLMDINDHNREQFKDLVEILEADADCMGTVFHDQAS
jgi:anti-anti-sigma factor